MVLERVYKSLGNYMYEAAIEVVKGAIDIRVRLCRLYISDASG